MTSVAESAPRTGTQSIQRALMLVKLIASQGQRGLRIKELTAASGLTATTVFRMVHGLISEGVIERDSHTQKLYLGQLINELGLAARQTSLRTLCRDTLARLASIARETHGVVYLSDRSGAEAVCVDRAIQESPHPGWPLDVGLRSPLGVGVGGLAILSALPDDTVEDVLIANAPRYESHPGLGMSAIRRGVKETRARGFARRDSVMVPGVVAIGVSFPYGHSTGSLTVACMKGQLDARRAGKVVDALVQARCRIAAEQTAAEH